MFLTPRRCRWLLALAATAILVLSLLPPGATPQPGGDKANHVLAFASLAWLGHGAFQGRARRLVPALIVFGLLIKLIQALTPHRTASGLDLVADAIGITAGLGIALLVARRRRHGSATQI